MCKVMDLNTTAKKFIVVLKDKSQMSSEYRENIFNFKDEESELHSFLNENGITYDNVDSWYIVRKRENDVVYISKHAFKRLHERNGWQKKTAYRMVKKIYEEGLRFDDLKGYKKILIKNKRDTMVPGDEYVIYGDYVYLFRQHTLLTAYKLPNKSSLPYIETKVS